MTNNNHTQPNDFKEQNALLNEHVVPTLPTLIAAHHQNRFEWFPTDLLPASANMNAEQLELIAQTQQQAQNLPNTARSALVLNLITEEGLPSYHRLLHEAFGADEAWASWRNQWTAEEDRHGNILRDYIRDCRLVDMKQVEQMQFEYVANGWAPEWGGDPYMTIAYTSFQERATQYSHRNLGKFVHKFTPNLTRVLACIAGDESRHYKFYCSLLKTLVKVDTRRALESMFNILQVFKMPGYEMPCFSDMALVTLSNGVKPSIRSISMTLKLTLKPWFQELLLLRHIVMHCIQVNLRMRLLMVRLLVG